MPKNFHLIVKSLERKNTSLIFTISLASILALSGFSMTLNEAYAQSDVAIGDFYCWIVDSQTSHAEALTLEDQFFLNNPFPVNSEEPFQFCESSDKDLDHVNNPGVDFASPFNGGGKTGLHYTTYKITGPSVPQAIDIVINNFSPPYSDTVTVDKPSELWVPNTKIIGTTQIPSDDQTPTFGAKRHFVCYDIVGDPITEPEMKFTHQFGDNFFTIDKPILLCNPVEKDHPPGTPIEFPIIGNTNHLVCFDFKLSPAPTGVIPVLAGVFDQIGNTDDPDNLLFDKACFESSKSLGQLSGTPMLVNGAALLMAGTQMIAAWIVPFVVAAVGIGIVIARKY